ncbi:hypothetical protein [Pseudovibrio ascidiaceicola]|uniref:hypothetical protein n=1 Tax=Pseudovibrio ascidiaceicola TaxID=285279 RepID=UPI0013573CFC|nr:hypothetical protein [Pseudovibrio ascidiaceicola]
MTCLSACASTGSDPPEPSQSYLWRFPTPTLQPYSLTYSAGVAQELETLPRHAKLRQITAHYQALRRAVCAIDTWQQPACQILKGPHETSSDNHPVPDDLGEHTAGVGQKPDAAWAIPSEDHQGD